MPWMATFTEVSNVTNHDVESKRVADDAQAFLRSGGKVIVIPSGVSGECDLAITEAGELIKARALSAWSAA